MYPISTKCLDLLRESHSVYAHVDLYFDGSLTVAGLSVVDGAVTVDRTQNVRRSCSLTFGDPTLFASYIDSALNLYGAELRVYQGVVFLDGTKEEIPLGVFTLEDLDIEESVAQSGGSLPKVTAYDRSQVLMRDQFLAPVDYSGWDIKAAITTLVTTSMPSVKIVFDPSLVSSILPGGSVFTQDRLGAVQTLCAAMGGEGYFDVLGVFQVVPIPALSQADFAAGLISPAWTVDASTDAAIASGADSRGVLISAQRGLSRTDSFNGVSVFGVATGSAAQPYATAFDTDPLSPTYWGGTSATSTPGPYGHVVSQNQNQAVTTTLQAQTSANAILNNSVGLSRSLNFTSLPNPALDAGDVVKAIFKDGTIEAHIVESLSVPLNPTTGNFTASTRTTSYQLPALPSMTTASTVGGPLGISGTWKLVFHDDFGSGALNTANWTSNWLGAPGVVTAPISSSQLACYDPAQVSVSNGLLHLASTRKTQTVGGVPYNYASGIVQSSGKYSFTYGAFEAKINVPGVGSTVYNFPAWMTRGTNFPGDGQIIIFEGSNNQPKIAFRSGSSSPSFVIPGNYVGWHTFSAQWSPTAINYYFDGANIGTVVGGITSSPMFLVLHNAITQFGTTGNLITNPDFEIDTSNWTTASSFWTTSGATLTRITTDFFSGSACANVTTTAASAHQGMTFLVTGLGAHTRYTVSAMIKWISGRPVSLNIEDTTNSVGASTSSLSPTGWQMFNVDLVTGASGSANAIVSIMTDGTTGVSNFHVDSVFLTTVSLTDMQVEYVRVWKRA